MCCLGGVWKAWVANNILAGYIYGRGKWWLAGGDIDRKQRDVAICDGGLVVRSPFIDIR